MKRNERMEAQVFESYDEHSSEERESATVMGRVLAYVDIFRQRFALMDRSILFFVIALTFIGLVMTYSATMYFYPGEGSGPDPLMFLRNQLVAVAIGWILLVAVATVLPTFFIKDSRVLNVALILINLSLLVLTVGGRVFGGAQSWLQIGPFYIQPSEFVKIVSILLVAWMLQHFTREVILTKELSKNKLFYGTVANILLALILIVIQPDFGMVAIIALTLGLTFCVMQENKIWNVYLYGGGILATGMVYLVSYLNADKFAHSPKHQLQRLGSFINPFRYYEEAGYQLVQGYIAFSQGGWFGRGIGKSLMKHPGGLPAAHTDFMISIIAEELGIVGAIVVLLLLLALVIQLFRWAARSSQVMNMATLTGVGSLLLVQTVVNLGGATGLLPLTGVTLPFVSYGGSSMIVSMLAIGVAQHMIIEEKLKRQVQDKVEGGEE